MNEATVWARAIYPLLMQAERDAVRAWAQVPLRATYPTFEISGVVDGVLGKELASRRARSTLPGVCRSQKRHRGSKPAVPTLRRNAGGSLHKLEVRWPGSSNHLWLLHRRRCLDFRERGSPWYGQRPTGVIAGIVSEYSGKLEAETIVKILQQIVAQNLDHLSQVA
jgi:hypothetical protein